MDTLNKHLPVLNFCVTSTNPADQLHYYRMTRFLDTSHREHEHNQDALHSKPKTSESFIRGRQTTLQYCIALLENLIYNCMCCMQLQMKSNHEPQISWFLRELPKVFMKLKFRACHEKHQVTCPWLKRTHVTHLHPVFTILGKFIA